VPWSAISKQGFSPCTEFAKAKAARLRAMFGTTRAPTQSAVSDEKAFHYVTPDAPSYYPSKAKMEE
jgi:hypothetical protein